MRGSISIPGLPNDLLICHFADYDYAPLPEHAAKEVGARRVEDLKEFLGQ